MPWIRVLLSCAIGDRPYPDPQWKRLAATWRAMYPLACLLPLIPTGQPGLYRIVSQVTMLEGGSGQMVFNGTVDLVGGSTQFQIHGAVCGG
jgi:hypothetical protein